MERSLIVGLLAADKTGLLPDGYVKTLWDHDPEEIDLGSLDFSCQPVPESRRFDYENCRMSGDDFLQILAGIMGCIGGLGLAARLLEMPEFIPDLPEGHSILFPQTIIMVRSGQSIYRHVPTFRREQTGLWKLCFDWLDAGFEPEAHIIRRKARE
jgi:hypothetical protein